MPPKGKRADSPAPGSEAKRSKPAAPEQDSVLETLSRSSSLAADSRAMLAAVLPYSLGVPCDERDQRQNAVVAMFEEALSGIEAGLRSSLKLAAAKVSEAEAAKAKLAEQAAARQAQLKESSDAAEAAKAALEAQRLASDILTAEVAKAEGALAEFEASTEQQRQLRASLARLLEDELRRLREGPFADLQEAEKLAAALLKVTSKIDLEPSLNSALLPTCVKAPGDRSGFDGMVLEQVAAEVAKREAELARALDASEARRAELQEAARAAQAASDAAHEDHDAADSALKEARRLEAEANQALRAAVKAEYSSEPAIAKAKKALGAAEAALAAFEGGAMRCFESLRDRKRSQPAEDAPAEAPGGDAREAAPGGDAREAAAQHASEP